MAISWALRGHQGVLLRTSRVCRGRFFPNVRMSDFYSRFTSWFKLLQPFVYACSDPCSLLASCFPAICSWKAEISASSSSHLLLCRVLQPLPTTPLEVNFSPPHELAMFALQHSLTLDKPLCATEPAAAVAAASSSIASLLPHARNTQKRSRKKANLSVTFANQVKVTKIASLHDMDQDQVASVYYNEDDREGCKEDVAMTLRSIRRRIPLDPTTQDTRGLEHLISREVYTELLADKNEALCSVFEAQDAQRSPEQIARAYSETTAEAAGRAQRRAKRDAFEATMNQKDWSNDPFAFFKRMNESGSSFNDVAQSTKILPEA